jgi:hypothetical protein
MKRLLPVAACFLSLLSCAQNYVPNYSFETYSQCPNNYGQVIYSTGWFPSWNNNNPTYHTEYMHSCGTSNFSVPSNTWGNQPAATGQAYMTTVTMSPSVATDYRENIYTQLIAPLTIGDLYHVSFKISFTESSQYATNNFGAKFSTVSSFPINNSCQIFETNVISDTQNWITISDTFTADSAYEYICIGNFMTDANTTVVTACSSCPFILHGYYVDDVCVWADAVKESGDMVIGDCTIPHSPQWVSSASSAPDFSLFPNPLTNGQSVTVLLNSEQSEPKSLRVVDVRGRTIVNQNVTGQNRVVLETGMWESGIYFVIFEGNGFAPVTRKLTIVD